MRDATYGFAHLIRDLENGVISGDSVQEKLRYVRRHDMLSATDIRHLVHEHFAAEPNVEALLGQLDSLVLVATGLDTLLATEESSCSLEASASADTR